MSLSAILIFLWVSEFHVLFFLYRIVCFEAPDLSEKHAFWREDTGPGRLGDEVTVRCMTNYYNEAALNVTSTTVRCFPDGWEAVHSCTLCEPPLAYVKQIQTSTTLFLFLLFFCTFQDSSFPLLTLTGCYM